MNSFAIYLLTPKIFFLNLFQTSYILYTLLIRKENLVPYQCNNLQPIQLTHFPFSLTWCWLKQEGLRPRFIQFNPLAWQICWSFYFKMVHFLVQCLISSFSMIIWIHGNKHKINVLQIDSIHRKLALAFPWEFPYTALEQLQVNVPTSLVRNRWSTSKKNFFKNLSVLMYSCCNGELWRSTTLMPVCKE